METLFVDTLVKQADTILIDTIHHTQHVIRHGFFEDTPAVVGVLLMLSVVATIVGLIGMAVDIGTSDLKRKMDELIELMKRGE